MYLDCGYPYCGSSVSVVCESCESSFKICGNEQCIGCEGSMRTTCERCGKECTICKNLGSLYIKKCKFCESCGDGTTDLHNAVFDRDIEYTKEVLKDNPTFINMEDICGKSPLVYAVEEGSTEIVEILLKHGADVRNFNHNQSLFKLSDNKEIQSLLVKFGNPSVKTLKIWGIDAVNDNNLEALKSIMENMTLSEEAQRGSVLAEYLRTTIDIKNYHIGKYLLLYGTPWKGLDLLQILFKC